ncbi:alkaline phosphatase D family protein [Planktotalea sp.]|uniref:alkaline phosphatase D family protein n=1 Tax=Planktotalea sp. TaxID=2029877 RepID=UPI003D6B2EC7
MLRVVSASCAKFKDRGPDQPAWKKIAKAEPDLLILLGDNVYAPSKKWSTKKLRKKYEEQFGMVPDFTDLLEQTQVLATWDDHDFGINNAKGETKDGRRYRDGARDLFLHYLTPRVNDPHLLSRVESEIYCTYEQDGVLFIVLDARYYRAPSTILDPDPSTPISRRGGEPEDFLGETQANWLWEQLARAQYGGYRATVICCGTTIGEGITDKKLQPGKAGERVRHYGGFLEDLRDRFSVCPTPIFLSGDIHTNRFVQHQGFAEVISSGVARMGEKKPKDNWAQLDFGETEVRVTLNWRDKQRHYRIAYS